VAAGSSIPSSWRCKSMIPDIISLIFDELKLSNNAQPS
jgi:hypothetical protein